jgi:hypothetical protein
VSKKEGRTEIKIEAREAKEELIEIVVLLSVPTFEWG